MTSDHNIDLYQIFISCTGSFLTFIFIIIGHDRYTFVPDGFHICPVAVTGPEEHWQQKGLNYRTPEDTQDHPVIRLVKLQAGKTYNLCIKEDILVRQRQDNPILWDY